MNQWVVVLFWASMAIYGLAAVLLIWGAILKRESLLRWGMWVTTAAFLPHTLAVILRGVAAGRLPVVETFENTLVGAWAMVVAFLLLSARQPRLKIAGAVVVPFVLLTLGYGATRSPLIIPAYAPAYKSGWLTTHVAFAWFTYATYTVAAGTALAEILKGRAERRGRADEGFYSRLPSRESMGDITFRLVAFGFVVNAVMMVTGAIWAYRLWGSYWSWDPVESWSLITWLVYGLYLHLRLTRGWRGPKLAWVAVAALFGVMMMFWGVQLMPTTFHLFQGMGTGRIPRIGG